MTVTSSDLSWAFGFRHWCSRRYQSGVVWWALSFLWGYWRLSDSNWACLRGPSCIILQRTGDCNSWTHKCLQWVWWRYFTRPAPCTAFRYVMFAWRWRWWDVGPVYGTSASQDRGVRAFLPYAYFQDQGLMRLSGMWQHWLQTDESRQILAPIHQLQADLMVQRDRSCHLRSVRIQQLLVGTPPLLAANSLSTPSSFAGLWRLSLFSPKTDSNHSFCWPFHHPIVAPSCKLACVHPSH